MKILVVVPSFEPSVGGGVASCIQSLCKGLSQTGVNVTVYTTNASRQSTPLDVPTDRIVNFNGVKIRYFPSTFGPKNLFDSRALTNELKRTVKQYDIVYVSAIWQWIGIDTAKMCYKNDVPMVVGVHGSFARGLRTKSRWKKNLFHKFAGRRAIQRATALHLTAEAELLEAKDWLEDWPSFVIPNAVDSGDYYPVLDTANQFREKYDIPINASVLITVGRSDWMKRVDLLIEALAASPNWYLLVVGPDDVGMSLKWKHIATKKGVSDRVVWTGYLDRHELLCAYSASNLFALISHNENFGMVVVEALLCGLPVLVSPEVGVWEMLEDAGVGKAVPIDVAAISNMLSDHITNNEQWENRAAKARIIAIAKFAPEKVADLMKTAFEDVLSGRRSLECRWHNVA